MNNEKINILKRICLQLCLILFYFSKINENKRITKQPFFFLFAFDSSCSCSSSFSLFYSIYRIFLLLHSYCNFFWTPYKKIFQMHNPILNKNKQKLVNKILLNNLFTSRSLYYYKYVLNLLKLECRIVLLLFQVNTTT